MTKGSKSGWRRRLPLLLAASLAAIAAPALAQTNPVLTANANGIQDEQTEAERTALRITSMQVGLRVHGRLADVTIEATIANRTGETDEGRFELTLPDDAVVTGYALDVEGRLIDGLLIEQPKARNVYEDEVRKGIDPGLAEVTAANRFVTRIYPITEAMPRRIRITFSVPFDPVRGLVLPIETAEALGSFALDADLQGYRDAPTILIGGQHLSLDRKGSAWTGKLALSEHSIRGGIAVSSSVSVDALLVSRHRNGKAFFQIADTGAPKAPPPARGGRLRVYWDRSLSRRDDLIAQEIDLLAAHIDAVQPDAVDLVTYASDKPMVTTLAGSTEVRAALRDMVYRGGTRLAALDVLRLPGAGRCLMFTDGLPTVDPEAEFRPDCRLTIVASAPDANGVRLGRLAQRTRGQLLRLTADNRADLLARLRTPAVAVVAARDDSGRRLDFRALPAPDGSWFVVGAMPEGGAVHLSIAGLGRGLVERVYTVDGAAPAAVDAPGALWAAQRTAELADDPQSHERMVGLARDFQVASPTMAFLVLERPDQYLSADLRPPAGFSAEWMDQYREARREREDQAKERKAERFDYVLRQWTERKKWWNTRFVAVARPKPRTVEPAREPVAAVVASAPGLLSEPAAADAASEGGDEMIVVTGAARHQGFVDAPLAINAITTRDAAGKTIEIDVEDVLADKPYLAALDKAAPADRLHVLAGQEATFGTLPAFYLDTAEWFRLKGDLATAETLLYSALDLPVADDETRQIVAFRLQRDGRIDRAIAMLERIAVTTDFRPQPKRALALALAERGRTRGESGRLDLERAFTMLTEVALEPAIRDFDGIELVALMEANALIPALDAVGGQWSLDRRLVGLLDSDVRIVIEWTADDADLDLWVIEPNGEKVYYGDQTSSAGGLISNDMTDGYGPEEYVIRRAPGGDYRVRVHGYDSDRLNPNGNGHVMVRMIRDFGRRTAQETLVDAEIAFDKSDDDGEGGLLIARMKVEGRRR